MISGNNRAKKQQIVGYFGKLQQF